MSLDSLWQAKFMEIGAFPISSCGVGGLNVLWNHCCRDSGAIAHMGGLAMAKDIDLKQL